MNARNFIKRTFSPSALITLADEYGDIFFEGNVSGLDIGLIPRDAAISSIELGSMGDVVIEIDCKVRRYSRY